MHPRSSTWWARHRPGYDRTPSGRSGVPAGGWRRTSTTTDDGVQLSGIVHDGPPDSGVRFVVCHGMTNATRRPGTVRVLTELTRYGAVLAFDFRGHGDSGGRSTVGLDEVADARAAVAAARAIGDEPVVLVGFSMGGSVVLRQQGQARRAGDEASVADVVVSVSAPSRWFIRESRSMLRVQWLMEHPGGALVGPRLGIRLGKPWADIPSTPLEEVSSIPPTPLLLVHGTEDHYFGIEQAIALHRAAPAATLWIVDGMRHGESGTTGAMVARIATWAIRAAGSRQGFSAHSG